MRQLSLFGCAVGKRRRPKLAKPPSNNTPTSDAARDSIADVAPTMRERVYGFIAHRAHGATNEEITVALDMRMSTVSARTNELKREGRIVESGETRPTTSGRNAAVLVVAKGS